jgi:hypothetical protein
MFIHDPLWGMRFRKANNPGNGYVREKAGVENSGWSESDCDRIFEESVAETWKAVTKTEGQGRIN